MLYGLLVTLFVIVCFLLIGLVLIQKGKGSMGIGTLGGGSQMLFGGSGGQDLFQKVTWILGTIFMVGSLVLGILAARQAHQSGLLGGVKSTTELPASNTEVKKSGLLP